MQMEKKTIVVCVIGNSFSEKFLRSWTELLGYANANNIQLILSNFSGEKIFSSKNKCLLADSSKGEDQPLFQDKIKYDYTLFLSNKAVFNVEHFKNLLEMEKDVVSCVSSNRYDLNKLNFIESIDYDIDASYEYVTRNNLKEYVEKHEDVLKVDYNEMTFTLIKKGVFEKIKYPWFNVETSSGDLSGDVYFYKMCKSLNIDTFISLKNIIGIENNIVI